MNDSSLLIAGFGVSGRAAVRLASFLHLNYDVIDEKDSQEMRDSLAALENPPKNIFFGWTPSAGLPDYEQVVLSPGIRESSPMYPALKSACGGRFESELSFAFRHVECPVVAITGTNGKTTTTELTCALFQALGVHAACAGNIGIALSDSAIETRKKHLDLLVVEISSFQLENRTRFQAEAAAFLNLASDHLDRHGSMENYASIKFRIFSGLKQNCVIHADLLPEWKKRMPESVHPITFSAHSPADFSFADGKVLFHGTPILDCTPLLLKGLHNIENIMAALALVSCIQGESALTRPEVRTALAQFKPDAHRLQLFWEKNGIRYINDSKATNPHAVNAALEAVGGDHNVILLLGGLDKDMDFKEMYKTEKYVKKAFLFGRCGEQIGDALSAKYPCVFCDSFESAVRSACADAVPGEIVMLSPATASMDLFKNYRERGDRFQELVRCFTE